MTWAAIFAVKFAFLFLFRNLVDRLPSMYMYWRMVVVFTALVFAFAVCDTFITCPKLGLDSCKYYARPFQTAIRPDIFYIVECAQSKAIEKALGLGATAISLDIVTDLLSLLAPPQPYSYNLLTQTKFSSSPCRCCGGSKSNLAKSSDLAYFFASAFA